MKDIVMQIAFLAFIVVYAPFYYSFKIVLSVSYMLQAVCFIMFFDKHTAVKCIKKAFGMRN